jgi:hypothetical protein
LQAERVPVQARYRTLALKTAGGSVAVFPAPHQYFFPRDFTSNLGFVWHGPGAGAWRSGPASCATRTGSTTHGRTRRRDGRSA